MAADFTQAFGGSGSYDFGSNETSSGVSGVRSGNTINLGTPSANTTTTIIIGIAVIVVVAVIVLKVK